jgi:molecular chaperone GrpE
MSRKKSKIELEGTNIQEGNRKMNLDTEKENIANETENNQEEIQFEEQEQGKEQVDNSQQAYKELNDKYLRLSAEFDNFRRRSLKEKMELIKTAGEDILISILPVVDNFERALNALEEIKTDENAAIREGIQLIYNNFKEFLSQRGVKELESLGKNFDTDHHEAISKIPAPQEDMKGKVIAVVEKGYIMHEKIIRFAKVVVGE